MSGETPVVADPGEQLFWTLMRRFEALAADRYATHAPALLPDAKQRFVGALMADEAATVPLAGSPLDRPTAALLACAQSPDEPSTLLVQGLVLECLAQAIYRLVAAKDGLGEVSRMRAAEGLAASEATAAIAAGRIAERVGTGDALYVRFAEVSHDVLGALDGLADPVDRVFGERFGLRFADVMGEFTADLIGTCTRLGMQRRKVVAHLAGAAMGF